MIPILYNASETAFSSQGLGALADAVSVLISRVVNGKDELTMVYPSTGLRYSDLANDRIIYATPEYKKSAQPYQIYKITKPLNGFVTVYARHVGSQRPGYIPVKPFTAGTLTETLTKLPLNVVETSPFTFWTNKTVTADFKLSKPASLGKVLGGMEGSILDVYGGEYEFDGYTIKLWDRRGVDSGVELRYGKNITDIEQSEDFGSIVTGVVPYWEGLDGTVVTLTEVVVEGTYADTYSFRRTIVKDLTEKFEEQPSEADLRAAATSYLAQSGVGLPNINLKVSFEHLAQYTGYENLQLLEKVNLGDTVSIFYDPLGVSASARIVQTVYDCLNDKYASVQVGSVKSSLERIMHQVSTTASAVKDALQQNVPSAIAEAVANATDLITGANGGYVILDRDASGKPYQILIMDTDNKSTATNVLRLNQNGIGFSTSGYSGPYSTAWTIDSNFVADYITTGNFNAALAKIGTLQDAAGKNSWNMVTGAFNITDGSMNISTNSASFDVISLHYDNGSAINVTGALSPAGFVSTNFISKWQLRASYANIYQTNYGANPNVDVFALDYGVAKFYTTDGTKRQEIDNIGGIRQYDANGKKRTYLEYGDIFLYTSAEKQTVQLSGAKFITGGSLQLYDTSANERTQLTVDALKFYSSSGTLTAEYPASGLWNLTGYKTGSSASMTGKVINLGVVSASDMSIASNASDSVVCGGWLAYCVEKYPHAKQCIFEGVALANSYRMMRCMIYDTEDVSGIQPNVATGQMQKYDGSLIQFGAVNYNVWTRTVTMSAQS